MPPIAGCNSPARTVWFIVFLILLSFRGIGGKEKGEEKIILEYADTLRTRDQVRELIGNVKVKRGDARLTADRALYDAGLGVIWLRGSVHYREINRQVRAQSLRYFERTGNFDAGGEIEIVVGDSLLIKCQEVHYNDSTGWLEMERDLNLFFFRDNSTISGEWGQFHIPDSTGVIGGEPVYRLPPQDGKDTLIIRSHKLFFSQPENWAKFQGEVRLEKGLLYTISDTLFYQPDSHRVTLIGAPVVWYKKDRLMGKEIVIHTQNGALEWMEVREKGVIISPVEKDTTQVHRLSGEQLHFKVVNDSTRLLIAVGSALGQYYVWDEAKGYQGLNISRADSIAIRIVKDRAEEILISGKASGEFYPPGLEPSERGGVFLSRDRLARRWEE